MVAGAVAVMHQGRSRKQNPSQVPNPPPWHCSRSALPEEPSRRRSAIGVADKVLEARLNVLWRRAEWSCECVQNTPASWGVTVTLYMGSAIAAQVTARTIDEVLRVSSFWREVIVGPLRQSGN